MGLLRLAESLDGKWQIGGWRNSSGTHDRVNVGSDVDRAAYNINELTPEQRREFERDGEIVIDDGSGGVVYLSR